MEQIQRALAQSSRYNWSDFFLGVWKGDIASSLENSTIQITRLESEKADANGKTASQEQASIELRGQHERLSTEVEASKYEIDGLKSTIEDDNNKFNALESEHNKCNHALKRTIKEKADMVAKVNSLDNFLLQLQGENSRLLAVVDKA